MKIYYLMVSIKRSETNQNSKGFLCMLCRKSFEPGEGNPLRLQFRDTGLIDL